LKEVTTSGKHKASSLFTYRLHLGADRQFKEKQCFNSIEALTKHMLLFLDMKFQRKQKDGEVEEDGWRFLPQIATKIITSNTYFYSRLQEYSMNMTFPIPDDQVHLLPYLFILRA